RAAGQFVALGLHRHPPEDQWTWRGGRGLSHRRPGAARHSRAGEPVRHRVAGPDRLPGDCRTRLRVARTQGTGELITRCRTRVAARAAGPHTATRRGRTARLPATGMCMQQTAEARPLKAYLAVGLLQGLALWAAGEAWPHATGWRVLCSALLAFTV